MAVALERVQPGGDEELGRTPGFDWERKAVANAMMVALRERLDWYISRVGNYGEGKVFKDLNWILRLQTNQKCDISSHSVLRYLDHPDRRDMFTGMGLINAETGLYHFTAHQAFLVKDRKGRWFAGSPANFRQGQEPSRLTTLYEGSLHEVMTQLKKTEGGDWPSEEFIKEQFRDNQLRMPGFRYGSKSRFAMSLCSEGMFFKRNVAREVPLV